MPGWTYARKARPGEVPDRGIVLWSVEVSSQGQVFELDPQRWKRLALPDGTWMVAGAGLGASESASDLCYQSDFFAIVRVLP